MKEWTAWIIALTALAGMIAANTAKGAATYQGKAKTVTVKFSHAYLIRGPEIGSTSMIRRLILSSKDVGAGLKACENMMCVAGDLEEGMTVDFDAGPRLNFWFVADGQKIQYSGTADPKAAKLATDSATQLTGTLAIDATKAGGPKVDVEFNASLVKELKK